MPVTFSGSSIVESKSNGPNTYLKSHNQIFDRLWGRANGYEELLQSTFSSGSQKLSDVSMGWENGFLNTVIDAWNKHHNLVLKPDDIWIAILTQFNFYVNAHSEELRTKFVTHKDKKNLLVEDVGTRYSLDFGKLATAMTKEIQKNVIDPELQAWILPDFTTTTFNDTVVCSVLMMATFKRGGCGIPNITLLGVKKDWEKILQRLGRLESFGEEPAAWAFFLRPIIMRFVDAFDGNYHPDFWSKIVHTDPAESGKTNYLSGWIASFCVWDRKGKWLGPPLPLPIPGLGGELPSHRLIVGCLPPSICEVDVKLDDNGEEFDCVMVAGHVGSATTGFSRDTLGMVPAWFMAVKKNDNGLGEKPYRYLDGKK
ncbi:hypothetical protein BJ165DRAFT_419619 [Panaeolus papilionaceus]|nr:hypothetical protein BJ165DRAFT_419619 [Panaeolus papilionaceus]